MNGSEDVRQRAGRIGAKAGLRDLRLRGIRGELFQPAAESPFEAQIDVRPSYEQLDDTVLYTIQYGLKAVDAEELPVFEADIAYSLLFDLPAGETFEDDDFVAFGEVSVLFMLHPYVREAVHDLTSRFGLPPLVLQVLRRPPL
jgi:preprotein translocase subunit SecB